MIICITQKMLATLYEVETNSINYHIKKNFKDSELSEDSTIRNFRIVQTEGSREVTRDVTHYNLQMIIAVGFKVNSERAVQFREIRASERKFYQKITDIYATSIDYDVTAQSTKRFYATVQNKMHYAVHGHTAAELIVERADSTKTNMGLTTWQDAGKITQEIAKLHAETEFEKYRGKI